MKRDNKFYSIQPFDITWRNYAFIIIIGMTFSLFIGITKAEAAGCPIVVNVTAPASLDVSPSVAVGSIIGTLSLSWPENTERSCSWPKGNNILYSFFGEGIPDGNLYPTSIPGIAYRGSIPAWSFAGMSGYWPVRKYYPNSTSGTIAAGSVTIEFVKTGPVGSGIFGPQLLMHSSLNNTPFFNVWLKDSIIIKPRVTACTVTSSTITETLTDTNQSNLVGIGTTAGEKNFNIPLQCTSATNISLVFSGDMADASNGVFKNTNNNNSANVGIQLLKDGTPVPTTAGSYINVGIVNGTVNLPMTARYYALTNSVPAGAVSAIAYATIVYN